MIADKAADANVGTLATCKNGSFSIDEGLFIA